MVIKNLGETVVDTKWWAVAEAREFVRTEVAPPRRRRVNGQERDSVEGSRSQFGQLLDR